MPRFFTHVRQGGSLAFDRVGVDFPSFALAHAAAIVAANQMIDADLAAGLKRVAFEILIDDEAGTNLIAMLVNVLVAGLQ